MTVYKTPEEEFNFLLTQFIDYDTHCKMPGLTESDADTLSAIIPEAAKFFEDIVAPTNPVGDRQPTKLVDGKVQSPEPLEKTYHQLCEAGWVSLSDDPEFGGAGLPGVVGLAVVEMMQSANLAFSLLPMLTKGVIHALSLYGSGEQKETYLANLISGHWSGTMNLTEPHAGTDLGLIKSRAVPQGDHYLISGQKIFITWGDQEFTDNVIHLVLAKTPDAPEGVGGISMFIVPKYLLNADGSRGQRNDIKTVALEHKMGIHASPTCVLQYGDEGGAIGYLVGEENKGLKYMFAMMNQARLSVGHQGIGVSERAYQHALAYAKDRLQSSLPGTSGPAPIIEHGDVRRMLMLMKSLTEASRAMSFYTIACEDRSHFHEDPAVRAKNTILVDVLTPLVKGWCTEVAQESTYLGVQIHGGMGFIEETGAAQFMRDARITPIYEGTNGIQALDLIGRKTLRDKGEGVTLLLTELQQLLHTEQANSLPDLRDASLQALGQCQQALKWLAQNPQDATAVAFHYLMLMGTTVACTLMAQSAFLSQSKIDAGEGNEFYRNKIATARFFATQVTPRNLGHLAAMMDGATNIMAIDSENLT